jgi:hypothetical protein
MLGGWDLWCRYVGSTGGSASGRGGDDGRARGGRVSTRHGSDELDCDGSRVGRLIWHRWDFLAGG